MKMMCCSSSLPQADVNKMKAELAVKNQELAVAAKEAEALLKQISESTTIAEKEKQKVKGAACNM